MFWESLNYHLVNTQWPASAEPDGTIIVPLSDGGKTPLVVTNMTLEPYVQGMSCLSCHVYARISDAVDLSPAQKNYSTDYRFTFGGAIP